MDVHDRIIVHVHHGYPHRSLAGIPVRYASVDPATFGVDHRHGTGHDMPGNRPDVVASTILAVAARCGPVAATDHSTASV